ncbi:MOSC domain-containing protein [Methylophilus sp. VKM B-3414]|uniref:MOSC domain-containing protein n=1 Tax=unclassified Methylophilus TaxID=2630143 RepID=UPI0018908B22|nr:MULTISPECIES: MOSC domain-containing protein [unclassified Methylophilus]MBF5039539.1 MOSC domain-containing protein [Methylophilus sp. 13]MDT7849092.1 MOSC domain-containing protein [Methylophilus sp. VKM B-3414]
MKLLSVNAALPQTVHINGKPVLTGIYKTPLTGQVALQALGLAGDGQADLTVHGGEHQALYAYPVEHYAHWQNRWQKSTLAYGTFGENLTVRGLLESDVCIGDILQIGDVVQVQVTMPRIPCFKFGHKVGKPDMLDEFLRSGYSGFYLRVLQVGLIQAGDDIQILQRDVHGISIRTALGLQKLGEGDQKLLQKALQVSTLAPLLRKVYSERLSQLG